MGRHERELAAAIDAVRDAARVCRACRSVSSRRDRSRRRTRAPSPSPTSPRRRSSAVARSELRRRSASSARRTRPSCASAERRALRESVRRAPSRGVARRRRSRAGARRWIDRGGARRRTARRYWTLDPIDGTKGFLRGEQYAVALALIEDGEVVRSACSAARTCPDGAGGTGCLLAAVRGQGTRGSLALRAPATSDGATPRARRRRSPRRRRALLRVRRVGPLRPGPSRRRSPRLLGITRRAVSASTASASTPPSPAATPRSTCACRRKQDYREKIWDHAAGMIVVEEAGGRVTDVRGQPLDFRRGPHARRQPGRRRARAVRSTTRVDQRRLREVREAKRRGREPPDGATARRGALLSPSASSTARVPRSHARDHRVGAPSSRSRSRRALRELAGVRRARGADRAAAHLARADRRRARAARELTAPRRQRLARAARAAVGRHRGRAAHGLRRQRARARARLGVFKLVWLDARGGVRNKHGQRVSFVHRAELRQLLANPSRSLPQEARLAAARDRRHARGGDPGGERLRARGPRRRALHLRGHRHALHAQALHEGAPARRRRLRRGRRPDRARRLRGVPAEPRDAAVDARARPRLRRLRRRSPPRGHRRAAAVPGSDAVRDRVALRADALPRRRRRRLV